MSEQNSSSQNKQEQISPDAFNALVNGMFSEDEVLRQEDEIRR